MRIPSLDLSVLSIDRDEPNTSQQKYMGRSKNIIKWGLYLSTESHE